jgi:hypothetical protein
MRPTIWLMEHFGVADALIGDLVEASAHHRSVWLWWQATGAIAAALARDIVGHPVLALRATMVGMLALAFCRIPLEWLWYQVDMTAMYRLGLGFLGLEHRYALASGIVRTILWTPSWLGTGWLMVRLQRSRTPVMVLPLLAFTWSRDIPEFWRLLSSALDQTRFRPYLAVNLFGLFMFNLSILVGAAWQRRRAQATSDRKTGLSLASQ